VRAPASAGSVLSELKGPAEKEHALALLVTHLEQTHLLSRHEILGIIAPRHEAAELSIPLSIFNDRTSALESSVKYLKENLSLKYCEIAKLLNRDDRTIWTSYSHAQQKFPKRFVARETGHAIPLSVLNDRSLPVLTAMVSYLKEHEGLRYSEIAGLLHRDQRTIWTSYHRRSAA